MDIEIREFITYLHNRKRTSHNTEVSYQRDLKKMAVYFADRGIYDIRDVGELELEGYLSYMERGQFASSTISRNVASIRALFQYLYQENRIERDPSLELKPPKVEKRMPEILTVDEVDRLLKQPDLNTPKGIRDSAMLELLYATGMRVSELLRLNLEDLNLRLGYVVCYDEDRRKSYKGPEIFLRKISTISSDGFHKICDIWWFVPESVEIVRFYDEKLFDFM